jgi:hypothetical protein
MAAARAPAPAARWPLLARLRQRLDGRCNALGERAQISGGTLEADAAGLEARQLQQVGHEVTHAVGGPVDVHEHAVQRLGRARRLVGEHDADRGLDAGERGAQVVGDVGQELVFLALHGALRRHVADNARDEQVIVCAEGAEADLDRELATVLPPRRERETGAHGSGTGAAV